MLFQNVRIFDGQSSALSAPPNVLVRGTKIGRISIQPIPVARSADTTIIDRGSRTLIPGLIDVHTHLTWTTRAEAEAST
jgi:imidazolonepropionase-like amidohydrolase